MLDNSTHWQQCQALFSIKEWEAAAALYELVTDKERAWEILRGLPNEVHALDIETTGLFPEDGAKMRLMQIYGPGGYFIFDMFALGGFEQFALTVAKKEWAVFYSGFEGNWIDYYVLDQHAVTLFDVGHMRRAKMGGGPLSLKTLVKKDLKFELNKQEQLSDWAAPKLTASQLVYAGLDAVVTYAEWDLWNNELTDEQWNGFTIMNAAWRAALEVESTSLTLDIEYHSKLIVWWTRKRDVSERYLRKLTPETMIKNLKSPKQLSDFIKTIVDDPTRRAWPLAGEGKKDQLSTEREVLRQAAHRFPYPASRWFAALMIYSTMNKYLSTYGQKLIDHQLRIGRIPSRFNIGQAATGRSSSSAENLQNIPHSPVVRRSFIAGRSKETGKPRRLVMADYSSIEVRTLGELAGDELLLQDTIYGNVHARSASSIFKIDYDEFIAVLDDETHKWHQNFVAKRSSSKQFTFKLLYGAGAGSLSVVLHCSDHEAQLAIEAWAETYPRAYGYRQTMFEKMNWNGFLPIKDGRTVFIFRNDRDMPKAANYPVQGAAASVMYAAMEYVEERLRMSELPARMAASVHDELLLLSTIEAAEEVAPLLVGGMIDGWLRVFPGTNTDNLVGKGNKATIGWSWAEKK